MKKNLTEKYTCVTNMRKLIYKKDKLKLQFFIQK